MMLPPWLRELGHAKPHIEWIDGQWVCWNIRADARGLHRFHCVGRSKLVDVAYLNWEWYFDNEDMRKV